MKTNFILAIAFLISSVSFFSCINVNNQKSMLYLPKNENFDTIIDGKKVELFCIKNKNGLEVWATNYGCRIISFVVPDKNGEMDDIVLGYRTIGEYLKDSSYFGGVVGRYANRIKNGKFTIDGQEYTLATNNAPNALHGGNKGFDRVVWDGKADSNSVTFTYLSKDMEEGYPGNMKVVVKYILTDNNELKVDYEATTDKTTIINLSQHSYFNLNGKDDSTILEQSLQINADYFTPIDSTSIPYGELMKVENTPFDFRTPKKIGQNINEPDEQLKHGAGYDHNWVLNKKDSSELSLAAVLKEEKSGRILEVYTTEPGIQFYSGNFLDGSVLGKSGKPLINRMALALETQHYPDSPNQPSFPNTVLKPGETYKQTCIYKVIVMSK
jgi:aldose 1-epimerase